MSKKNDLDPLMTNYDNDEDDPDFELSFYPMSADLARKFKDCKVSAKARCAYDFISLNASNVRNGISRPIDFDGLCEYLELSKRRIYGLLAELEAHGFIVPRNRRSRWMYDIPALSGHTENMKKLNAQKKARHLERKIELIAVVLNRKDGFSTRQRDGFIKIFRETESFDNQLRRINLLLGRPLSLEEQERLKTEFEKL